MSLKQLFQVRRSDLRMDVFRAGGKGGQKQNKTSTGVRFTHLATGISAESREHRTQTANRRAAFHKLVKRLTDHFTNSNDAPERVRRVVRSYVLAGSQRIVDHDTGECYSAELWHKDRQHVFIEDRAKRVALQGE